MTTIFAGDDALFTVTVMKDGSPVPISNSDTLTASVYALDGRTVLVSSITLSHTESGANWASGIIAIALTDVQTADLPAGDVQVAVRGSFGLKRFKLTVETMDVVNDSIFIKDIIVDDLRSDSLLMAASGVLESLNVSDSYLWDKIRAAESEIAHELRVPLVPTKFFNVDPTPDEIAALDGMPWVVESAPDYEGDMFTGNKWGYIVTRQKPIISVDGFRFVYPTEQNGHYDIPLNWLSIDRKYGHVRIVPTSNAVLTGLAGLVMFNLSAGRTIPSMVRMKYTAGLENAARDFPELIDAIKKKAVLKIIGDAFLPQSGSISADGLSESLSVDMDKYSASIDLIINGSSGSNGGLMAAIHGVRMMAF
jgi:hypothetical protein